MSTIPTAKRIVQSIKNSLTTKELFVFFYFYRILHCLRALKAVISSHPFINVHPSIPKSATPQFKPISNPTQALT
jgi:hypothetical protein